MIDNRSGDYTDRERLLHQSQIIAFLDQFTNTKKTTNFKLWGNVEYRLIIDLLLYKVNSKWTALL